MLCSGGLPLHLNDALQALHTMLPFNSATASLVETILELTYLEPSLLRHILSESTYCLLCELCTAVAREAVAEEIVVNTALETALLTHMELLGRASLFASSLAIGTNCEEDAYKALTSICDLPVEFFLEKRLLNKVAPALISLLICQPVLLKRMILECLHPSFLIEYIEWIEGNADTKEVQLVSQTFPYSHALLAKRILLSSSTQA